MRSAFAVSLAALLLLASIASVAQSEKKDSDGLVARLSYQSGGMVMIGDIKKVIRTFASLYIEAGTTSFKIHRAG